MSTASRIPPNKLPAPAPLFSERLILRPLQHEDANDVFQYASQPIVSRFLSWSPHETLADSHDFIASARAGYRAGRVAPWGIEHRADKKLIGTITFLTYSPVHALADIGYVISPDYWGQGIAPEAARTLIQYGFETLSLNRIEAQCRLENQASSRVLEKAGLKGEAVLRQRFQVEGTFHDSHLFSILYDEWQSKETK